ncbi:glycosyltransferase family 4 protein [Pseudarthrobacter sp. S9]|uniref:glycosyltransferase family 4 protein n=1 Tax=Pseudarthrobacter sp. S9 TaxID=3418421 RepID=UPI003CFE8E47
MRIGLIAPPWFQVPPPSYGGTESVIDTLARGLADAGHEVLLAASGDSTCPVPRVPGLPSADTTTLGSSREEIRHVVRSYAAMTDVDILHDHTLIGPLYRHRPLGVPLVTTTHGPFAPDLRDLYQAISADAAVVAISHHQASTARNFKVARVIHHGIDVGSVPTGSGSGQYACFLGRMNPSKGIREAIMIARRAQMPLRIAAKMHDKAEHEYFTTVIQPLLGPDVEYLGELDAEAKYRLLGEAAALLSPLQWPEPFGLVMIEALATGTPVVSTRRGAAPEIVTDGLTGFLRTGEHELASALQNAASLDRGGCRRSVEERFSSLRMVQRHLQLYSELTGIPLTNRPAVTAHRRGMESVLPPALTAHLGVSGGHRFGAGP